LNVCDQSTANPACVRLDTINCPSLGSSSIARSRTETSILTKLSCSNDGSEDLPDGIYSDIIIVANLCSPSLPRRRPPPHSACRRDQLPCRRHDEICCEFVNAEDRQLTGVESGPSPARRIANRKKCIPVIVTG